MSAPLPLFAAQLRRRLLAEPGITSLPVCPRCTSQVQPSEFGREACKPCEAERAAVSEAWDAMRDHEVGRGGFAIPAEPMYGSDEAARPFLVEDEGE